MAELMYVQGPLRVVADDDGYVVSDDDGEARVSADAAVVVDGDAAVVGVVAAAIAARLKGRFHVHAGAVAVGDDGLWLIAGDGGRGKTTTTLSLSARYPLLGDDVVYVHVDGDDVIATALARPLHVGEVTRRMFQALELTGATTRAGKAVATWPLTLAEPARSKARRVTALIFPRIAAATPTTTATMMSAPEAMAGLLVASAMVSWPRLPNAQAHLDALAALSKQPALSVCLGADAVDAPQRIVDLITARLIEGAP